MKSKRVMIEFTNAESKIKTGAGMYAVTKKTQKELQEKVDRIVARRKEKGLSTYRYSDIIDELITNGDIEEFNPDYEYYVIEVKQ